MRLNTWQEKGQYFQHEGHPVFYRTAGAGEPLLLLHGLPTASWDWWKVWPDLATRYQLIASDMMGFGFSAKPTAYKYSILDQADLQEALLHQLGVTSCHILAHDYGDTVAQELLARANAGATFTIKSVCFLNGGLFPGVHKPRLIQNLLLSPIGFLLSRLLTREKLATNFKAIFGPDTQPSEEEIDEFWALNTFNQGTAIVHKLIQYMAERRTHESRWRKALQETNIPLRLIDGGYDPISGAHMAAHYQQVIPNPDVVVLEGIGHYPQVEAPERVLQHYLSFREGLDH